MFFFDYITWQIVNLFVFGSITQSKRICPSLFLESLSSCLKNFLKSYLWTLECFWDKTSETKLNLAWYLRDWISKLKIRVILLRLTIPLETGENIAFMMRLSQSNVFICANFTLIRGSFQQLRCGWPECADFERSFRQPSGQEDHYVGSKRRRSYRERLFISANFGDV